MTRKPFLAKRRGRHLDILAFVFLVVENKAIQCVLERQRERKKETIETVKQTNKQTTRGRKEENKSQMGKCQGDESFP